MIPAVVTVLLLNIGCGEKQPPVETEAEIKEKVEIAERLDVPSALAAPKVFTDPQKQSRFESLFNIYTGAFVAPQPGILVRAEKKDGTRIDGEFTRYTAEGIMISTPEALINIQQSELTEASQALLFPDAFSRQLAEKQMAIDAVEGKPADPQQVFFPPAGSQATEVRRFTADHMPPRLGPGRHYAAIEGAELFRGQNVFVVEEKDGWIAVKDSEQAPQAIGWIPKYASFLTNPENKEAIAREVDTLIEDGMVVDVDPKKNEALVDIYAWKISDSASVEGMSRLLAFYCGQQKGVRLFWVDIKDALTNRRLAEYSESKGFKVY